jgi:hypothetical protein
MMAAKAKLMAQVIKSALDEDQSAKRKAPPTYKGKWLRLKAF